MDDIADIDWANTGSPSNETPKSPFEISKSSTHEITSQNCMNFNF